MEGNKHLSFLFVFCARFSPSDESRKVADRGLSVIDFPVAWLASVTFVVCCPLCRFVLRLSRWLICEQPTA